MSSQEQGQQLSARDLAGLFGAVQNGTVTEEQIEQVYTQIPEETKKEAITTGFQQFVVPEIEEIRDRAEADVSCHDVREQYAELDDEDQQDVFNEAVGDVLASLFETRTDPTAGLPKLKGLLRDPYTIEGLLLIFDNDQYIDPEYSSQMKDFAAMHLKWMGVAILPEMYDEETVTEVAEQIGLDVEQAADPAAAFDDEQ